MKVLTAHCPEVTDLIKAMGIDSKNLVAVDLSIRTGEIVKISATYTQELWVSDLKSTTEFVRKYELREVK